MSSILRQKIKLLLLEIKLFKMILAFQAVCPEKSYRKETNVKN